MNNCKKIIGTGLLLFALLSVSGVKATSFYSRSGCFTLDRGLEIHYIKMELKKGEEAPKKITVYGVEYPLYKTKEEAYNSVLNASLKRDITVVYVISSVDKDTETLSLTK